MNSYLKTYIQYWRINFLTMIEYRANFLMWLGFTIIYHGSAVVALWVTLKTFPSMNGWDFREMAFLYALWMLGNGFFSTFFFGIGEVPNFVQEGRFDRFLVRPQDTLFSALTVPQQIWPDVLVLALLFYAFTTVWTGVRVDFAFVVFSALVMVGGALIDFGVQLAVATLGFWFVRVDTLRWIVMSLEQEYTRYPISIYTKPVRLILTFVFPFAFMNYFPAALLLHKTENGLALSPHVGLLTPVVGLVWVAAAYAFWRIGVDRYQGTGS